MEEETRTVIDIQGTYTIPYIDSTTGNIIAAIGDSITEGYHGQCFYRENLHLKASDFPAEAVSRDGRNFPQFSPTTKVHKPGTNCMQSWMTRLNDLLTAHFQRSFFIANEGWGGYTSGQYFKMAEEDNWRARICDLKPNIWLIHLGVNDERQGVPVEIFYENMSALLEMLIRDFNAQAKNIYLARPCYDYCANFELMEGYLEKINLLIKEYKINAGADFYQAFSVDKEKWYGEDPVHPNIPGMDYMAELWADILYRHEID